MGSKTSWKVAQSLSPPAPSFPPAEAPAELPLGARARAGCVPELCRGTCTPPLGTGSCPLAGQCQSAAGSRARADAQLCAGSSSVLEPACARAGTGPGGTRALGGRGLEPGQLSLRLLHVKDVRRQWAPVIMRAAGLAAGMPLIQNTLAPGLRVPRGQCWRSMQSVPMLRDAWGPQVLAAPRGLATAPVVSPSTEGLAWSLGAGTHEGSCSTPPAPAVPCCHGRDSPGSPEPRSLPVPPEPTAAELGSGRAAMGDVALMSSTAQAGSACPGPPVHRVPPAQCQSQLVPVHWICNRCRAREGKPTRHPQFPRSHGFGVSHVPLCGTAFRRLCGSSRVLLRAAEPRAMPAAPRLEGQRRGI